MSSVDLDDLRSELEDFAEPKAADPSTALAARVLSGFSEIVGFHERTGRLPQHGEQRDIFERLYAVRLDRILASNELRDIVASATGAHILQLAREQATGDPSELDMDDLAAQLSDGSGDAMDLTTLVHIPSRAALRAVVEEIGRREPCPDFKKFSPMFEQVQRELKSGARQSQLYADNPGIHQGDFFILNGVMGYVDEIGDRFQAPNGQMSSRLRLVFANGTQSNMLLTSLQRAFLDDPAGRRVTGIDHGPLFGDTAVEGDEATGTIYVLRSESDNPAIAANRQLIHKIGVTGGSVETRIAGAESQPTFLFAPVQVVTTFTLYNINRVKLENLLHRIFRNAQLDMTIEDRFGKPVKPREWFLVPLQVIEEAVNRIQDGTIVGVVYDPSTAAFVRDADLT